jgi:voltage-gated potassium channel
MKANRPLKAWQITLHEIIFESDTPAGKAFDIVLLAAILLSVLVVLLDSVPSLHAQFEDFFLIMEWTFTLLFTLEYGLRLISLKQPHKYAKSALGIIDVLAILPTYLSLLLAGTQYLMVVRALRLLRVFRIFKMVQFLGEGRSLALAILSSMRKISLFVFFVLLFVVILGSVMYLVEGEENGFTSIPESIYWAIVTLTTVGYGDISPGTPLGKFIASLIMICGYGIIAVPTGIITTEMALKAGMGPSDNRACSNCSKEGHDYNAAFCKFCGEKL